MARLEDNIFRIQTWKVPFTYSVEGLFKFKLNNIQIEPT